MLPFVLVAATLAVPVETPFGIRGHFMGLPARLAQGGYSATSAVHYWGDPSAVRGGVTARTLTVEELIANPPPPLESLKRPPVAPQLPPDPTAERIKAIENVLLELKARGGPAAVIEVLQRDLDELKKK